MTRERAERLAQQWAFGGVCTLREGEAAEYHKMFYDLLLTQKETKGVEIDQVKNDPLTLDELRQMDGEPVWVCFIGDAIIREDGWFIVSEISASQIFIKGKVSLYKNLCYYGETWLAYHRKPKEGTE